MIRPARLPSPVGPGDRVGVAALSGPVDPVRLEAGLAALRRLGFEPVLADNLSSRHGFLAGSDEERLAAFHRLAADRDLPAIFFARGGHGLLRILPGIDWRLLAHHPRAYVGYSDLTPFLLRIVERLGLVSFHGPMVAAELARGLTPDEESSLLAALAGRYPVAQPVRFLREPREPESRTAAGILLGGCLSLLVSLLGTPFFPDLRDSLLFWEDVNEPRYKIDRMLTHFRLSGHLAAIEGMIVGHLGWTEGADKETADGMDWPALVEQSVAGFDWPLAWGLESGHLRPNRTLPLGLLTHLDARTGEIVFGEFGEFGER